VVPPEERRSGIRFLESHRVALGDLRPQVKEVESERVAEPILVEARSGYDLLLLGAPEPGTGSTVLFNPLVDYLTGAAPCPTVIVRPGRGPQRGGTPTRILVPTNGTHASRRAAEIAFRWAWKHQAEVTVLTVVPDVHLPVGHLGRRRAQRRQDRLAGGGIVSSLTEAAAAVGVRASGVVRRGSEVAQTVLEAVEAGGHDLVILGTVLRLGSGHLFLGPTVEEILEASEVDVIIVNS
jgi:nucleotide-binding universal stress UspA family protein